MHSTENTNAYNKKIGGRMCVTCLFEVQALSLLSTIHALSVQSIAIEVTQHKHTIPMQTKSGSAHNWQGWM
jgi:hypothetical protein